MLVLLVLQKEAAMDEQHRLFEDEKPSWIDQLWQRTTPEARNKVISILAEVAHRAVAVSRKPCADEGETDES